MIEDIEYPEIKYPKGGAGKKAEDRFPENWKEIIIDLGKQGKHLSAIWIALRICKDTHYELLKRNEEYDATYQEYLKYCEDWWFEQARESIVMGKSKMFNQHLWTNVMKNKFRENWKDESQLDVTTNGEKIVNAEPIKIEIIRSEKNGD